MNGRVSAGRGVKLTDEQRLDWLQLIRSDNVGPRTFRTLINRYGGARPALEALPELARRAFARPIRLAARADCEREMEGVSRLGGTFIALGEPDYPPALAAIEAPPPLLAVRGRSDLFVQAVIAIVGSRNASANGLAFAERLAREIGAAGHAIASGLARGIDAAAHRASLNTGTAAVLAGGLDRIYPSENVALLEEIAERGVVLTEMPLGWEPRGRDFPRRNRIVSGISMATIVVEASLKSGSLITARFALEQGREVFAVPGSPLDPRSAGANDLLRQGATLCTSARDVIESVAPLLRQGAPAPGTLFEDSCGRVERLWDESDAFGDVEAPEASLSFEFDEPGPPSPVEARRNESRDGLGLREALLQLMGPSPVHVDDLIRSAAHSASDVRGLLFELELEGLIDRQSGDRVALSGRG